MTEELKDIHLELGFAPWRKVQVDKDDELVINTIAGAHQVHCQVGWSTLVYPIDPKAPPVVLTVSLREPFGWPQEYRPDPDPFGIADFPELFA